ncbi:unnamed protein product, partial [Amoebophrya sp. A25]|eukprot:GSA25T00001686001.1
MQDDLGPGPLAVLPPDESVLGYLCAALSNRDYPPQKDAVAVPEQKKKQMGIYDHLQLVGRQFLRRFVVIGQLETITETTRLLAKNVWPKVVENFRTNAEGIRQ